MINGDRRGFTLLEVVISMSLLGIIMAAALALLLGTVETADTDLLLTHAESDVQNAADEIVTDLKETAPNLCAFYNFQDPPSAPAADQTAQTVIVFPSARRRADNSFIYKDSKGEVQPGPVWQSVRVYCFARDPGQTTGSIYCYNDYSVTTFTDPVTVAAVTDNTITLQNAAKKTVCTLNRRTGAVGAQQTRVRLKGSFTQMLTEGSDPEPIRLTVVAECPQQVAVLRGSQNLQAVLTNEVLSRNRN